MRKTLLFLLIFSAKLTFGQFVDNFNDSNFTVNPVWLGQTSLFTVNENKQLNSLLSSVSQIVSLSTSNSLALNVRWEFSVQLHFDPSSTNLTRIYLVADKEDLKGSLNGYFIQIGESGGADSYDLYRQTGNLITKIIDCPPKNRVNFNFLSTKLRVTRDDFGKWEVYSATPEEGAFILEGSVIDRTFINTNWFGVYNKYTATRSDGFVFDDFKVEELVSDLTPPKLMSIRIVDENQLEATFSEALAQSSALITSNYRLKGENENPVSVVATSSPNIFSMRFAKPFLSSNYTLVVDKLSDLKGNSMTENSEISTFYVKPYTALKGDIVINEIFADPSPSIGLPQAEFVELWNTTSHYIILTGWKYADLTSTIVFSADTIRPNEYLILSSSADAEQFKEFGRTARLSSWPSLNNDKDKLMLFNDQNAIIDEVFYTSYWYKNSVKAQGGFSLELIDPDNKCRGVQNWQASNHIKGGTPGAENSIYRQQVNSRAPKISSATVVNDTTILLSFDKSIDSLSGALITNYKLNNGIGTPLSAIPQAPNFSTVVLIWTVPIERGKEHTLSVNYISDCAGNLIDPASNTAPVFLAKEVLAKDILISEVLVNPKVGGTDFIEIYNNTNDIKDLATLKLATIDANGNIFNVKAISDSTVYIPAKCYWVLTSDTEVIKQQYEVKNLNNLTKIAVMPSYNNESGTVILLSDQGMIDRFDYHENMHFAMLQFVKGVSLERVSFQKGANDPYNFKSAAQASGFATPTYKNSQEKSTHITNEVWLSNKVFSPDGDGFDDPLQINFRFIDQEYLASVTIYNEGGVVVRKLVSNSSIPRDGFFTWDGLNDIGNKCKIGIYVVNFEVFALNGKVNSFKRVCALAKKLN